MVVGAGARVKRGYEVDGRHSQDPIGSDAPRGKNRERRKHKLDGPTLTPTEQYIRNGLMRQFLRNPEGSEGRDASAYKSSAAWCRTTTCKHLATKDGLCDSCAIMGILDCPSSPCPGCAACGGA